MTRHSQTRVRIKPVHVLILLFFAFVAGSAEAQLTKQGNGKVIRTLIVDGQNNHEQWPKITFMMKRYLEETGKFSVDVKRSYYTWNGADLIEKYKIAGVPATKAMSKSRADSSFHPDFSKYDLVVCNFGWNAAPWSDETQADFEKFMKNGGGLVVVHAADNSFPMWPAYNKMIGLEAGATVPKKMAPMCITIKTENLSEIQPLDRLDRTGRRTSF